MSSFKITIANLGLIFDGSVNWATFNTLQDGYITILPDHDDMSFFLAPGELETNTVNFLHGFGIASFANNVLIINSASLTKCG